MTVAWMTKYGARRVRHEPPTLEEAIAAAEGLTSDPQQQVQIAAELMQVPLAAVRADAERIVNERNPQVAQTAHSRRILGKVLVERRNPRRIPRAIVTKSLVS